MTISGTTMTIASPNGTIVIDPEDNTNVLLANLDPNNTIYLANIPAVNPGLNQSDNVPLPPGGNVVLDSSLSWYAATVAGQSANLAVIPGGVSYFQAVEIITKSIILTGNAGTELLAYNPADALNDLIASISTGGTDANGNVLLFGLAAYGQNGTHYGAVSIGAGLINFWHSTSESAGWTSDGGISDAFFGLLATAGVEITAPLLAVDGALYLQEQGSTPPSFSGYLPIFANTFGELVLNANTVIEGLIQLLNIATPAAIVGFCLGYSNGGNLHFVSGVAGDGNDYSAGHIMKVAAGQTVNSLALAPVTGIGSINLGIGIYEFEAVISSTGNANAAAGAMSIELVTGGGLVATSDLQFKEFKDGAAGANIGQIFAIALNTLFNSTTFSSTTQHHWIEIRGIINVTTAGTLTPEVATVTAAADSWNLGIGTHVKIKRV